MRALYHPDRDSIMLTTVLAALSDPTRLAIVRDLAAGAEQRCDAFEVPVAKSTLSHHFKVLREAGVTETRIEGTQRIISLRRDDLDQRFAGLLDTILRATAPL